MAMDVADIWRHCFQQWPTDLERRGVLVTTFDQIPFDGFVTSDEMLLIERRVPDTVGARMLIVPYAKIEAVKIVDVVKFKAFQSLGFSAAQVRK